MGGGFSAFTAFVACVGKREVSQLPFLIFFMWVCGSAEEGGASILSLVSGPSRVRSKFRESDARASSACGGLSVRARARRGALITSSQDSHF